MLIAVALEDCGVFGVELPGCPATYRRLTGKGKTGKGLRLSGDHRRTHHGQGAALVRARHLNRSLCGAEAVLGAQARQRGFGDTGKWHSGARRRCPGLHSRPVTELHGCVPRVIDGNDSRGGVQLGTSLCRGLRWGTIIDSAARSPIRRDDQASGCTQHDDGSDGEPDLEATSASPQSRLRHQHFRPRYGSLLLHRRHSGASFHGATFTSIMLSVNVDRAASVDLHTQVAAAIRRAIDDGEAAPGERLPPAKDLAAELGVNTNTVLRALRTLRDEGLLEFRRGLGVRVAPDVPRGELVSKTRELLDLARARGYATGDVVDLVTRLS